MVKTFFITGIGTDIGKTLVSAIIAEALQADYWKPVQAGDQNSTDAQWVRNAITNDVSTIHPEIYKLKMPASPHISAREENIHIDITVIKERLSDLYRDKRDPAATFIIEGAGGLLVPLNESEFVADLIRLLDAKVILVSRNYLGSINHSLLTAEVCKYYKLDVAGWIFNDQYLSYEDEIVHWSGYPKIASIPYTIQADKKFVFQQAVSIKQALEKIL